MDNEAAIKIATCEAFSKKLRHVNTFVLWVREQIKNELVSLHLVSSEDQAADFLTKPLGRIQHNECCKLNGINLKYEFEPYMVSDRVRKGKDPMHYPSEHDMGETSATGEARAKSKNSSAESEC